MVEETKFNNQFVYENNGEIKIQNELDLNQDEIMAIEAFRYTYNAKYIEDLSPKKKEIACGDNPILIKLMNNLNRPRTYITDYLEGPITFTKVTFENEWKIFYIFGERHMDTRGQCLNIPTAIQFHEYIKKLSLETIAFFDFYFETPKTNDYVREALSESILISLIPTSPKYPQQDLQSIFNELIDYYNQKPIGKGNSYILSQLKELKCRNPVTKLSDEDCSLIRIHDIDMRSCTYKGQIHDNLYAELFLNIFENNEMKYSFKKILTKYGSKFIIFFENYIDDDVEVTANKIFNFALLNPKVKIELDSSYMKSEIERFIKLKIKEILQEYNLNNKNYSEFFKRIINYIQTGNIPENIQNELNNNNIFVLTVRTNASTMDIYGLSRIFKFHYPRENTVQSQPVESTNIIIYAGDKHSVVYSEFLEFIGGKVENIDIRGREKKHPSCVKTSRKIRDFNSEEAESILQGGVETNCSIM